MNNKIYFSVDDIQEVATEDSVEFAIARIAVLSTKQNSHKVNITKEILERDGKSVLGKWVIADFDGTDVTTHTHNTHIIGIVPSDSNIEFVDNPDGTTTMFVDAIISKLYATEIYNLFKTHNFRNVSVEMATTNDQEQEDGSIDIDGLNIYSICVLGISVGGSCPDANMSIVRFSEKNAEEYYQNIKTFSLKQLAEQRNEKLKVTSHPIDKSKEAVDMGSWNGDKAKDDLLKEKNYKTLAKSVCLLLEDGWEDKEKGALKYPVMNLKNGKWVYNAQGLSSARAYGEQHDPSVADKAISIQKKLGLYKDNDSDKEEKMEKDMNKDFSNSEDKEKDVVMSDNKDEKDMACGDDKKKEMTCDNKEMASESEDEKLKEEKKEEDDIKDEEKKMSDDSEDEKLKEEKEEEDDIKDEEKKFSLNAYVDEAAMLAMLENETDEFKALVDKVTKEFSANEIVAKFIEMAKENAELKADKEKNDKEKTDKKFASIMASVKEDLDEESYSKLAEEGKQLSLDQLGAFENKVKAFAYEATKKNNKHEEDSSEIMMFGSSNNENGVETDVFARISKM
jgi:hypothetical protein